MKYKNICLTITNLANRGGEERMCAILANALVDYGYYVIIVSTDKPSSQKVQFEVSDKVKCYSLKSNRIENKLSCMSLTQKLWLLKYKMILKRHKIQVVIDVDVHNTLITSKVVDKKNVRIISWHHFNYDRYLAWPTRHELHDCFVSKISKLVVLTKSDEHDFIRKEGIDVSIVKQIYNPSPIHSDAELHHNGKKVLAIGRFAEQKGFDLLLRSWAIVERMNDDWTLEIVGDGAQRKELEDEIENLGLQRVLISPFTTDIKKKYQDASAYVLSSRHEGFALVLLEAMSMSLPIVSFNCPTGPEEIVKDGVNGYLVTPLDTDGMAKKLLLLMENDEKRKEMGRNSFQLSKQYQMSNIMCQWIELLESV